jgi:hypothetical protein
MLPASMPVLDLVKRDIRDEDPVKIDPEQLRSALAQALAALGPSEALRRANSD